MNLNLDKRTIGFFKLGDEFESSKREIKGMGYSIFIGGNVINGFSIWFREIIQTEVADLNYGGKIHKYQTRTPSIVFANQIIMGSEVLEISKYSKPEEIASMFGVECDCWDDEVALGMSFVSVGLEYEFSWSWVSGKQYLLDYLIVELYREKIS